MFINQQQAFPAPRDHATPVSSKGNAISVSCEGILNACLRTYPVFRKLIRGMLVFFQLHLHTKKSCSANWNKKNQNKQLS